MILGVSIITRDGKRWDLPAPHGHPHIIAKIFEETGKPVIKEKQGFYDDQGKFLTRHEAEDHARACGQLTKKKIGSILTSEDLWKVAHE